MSLETSKYKFAINRIMAEQKEQREDLLNKVLNSPKKALKKVTYKYFEDLLIQIENLPSDKAITYLKKKLNEITKEEFFANLSDIELTLFQQQTKRFLDDRLKYYTDNDKPQPHEIAPEKHTNIFRDDGFRLFEYLLNNCTKKYMYDGRHADISHYYRRMSKDRKYITANITYFQKWFLKTYNEDITKIKTIDEDTIKKGKRDESYSKALVWFKQQN